MGYDPSQESSEKAVYAATPQNLQYGQHTQNFLRSRSYDFLAGLNLAKRSF